MKHVFLISLLFLLNLVSSLAFGESRLSGFLIKENLLKNDKIAVIAADSSGKPQEISGVYNFTINGFRQDLRFNDGIAVIPLPIEKSTFIFLKHEDESNSVSKLFYVLKKNDSLNPFEVNLKLLAIIPLALIIFATIFRKFLVMQCLFLWLFSTSI